jgi:putative ATPase
MPARRRPASGSSLFAATAQAEPLAARMRPRSIEEYVGQAHLLAPGKPLRVAIEKGLPTSMIFWGPPGTGKTTLGWLLARYADREFVPFSAVTEGVPRVREIIAEARDRLDLGRRTILFVDEIHRFNRAQQDAFLPAVEAGIVTLVGATTENPSFELNGALLSRTRVFVLNALGAADLETLLRRALADRERGIGADEVVADDDAIAWLARESDGDARRALNALEAAAEFVGKGGRLTPEVIREAMQLRAARYDKGGEEHYNLISALHKSMRNSDPDAAVYWVARMLEAGEDPLYIARRLVRFASEDVGNADPQALVVAVAARDAAHFMGMPEGNTALAQAAIYLATAPKSNAVYTAYNAAAADAHQQAADPVPLHLRNAPTKLMKELEYGKGYQYAHEQPDAVAAMECLPPSLAGRKYYRPTERGFEREIKRRLDGWAELKTRKRTPPARDTPPEREG